MEHYGMDPGDLLVLHIDTDVVVPTAGRDTCEVMQSMSVWLKGNFSHGDLEEKGLTLATEFLP